MRIDVAIAGYPGPEHLPLIVAGQEGWFAEAGLEATLASEPDGALEALAAGRASLAVDTPLRLLDGAPAAGVRAAGCFFESEGGVLLHRDAAESLFDGDPVQISARRIGERGEGLARRILGRWAESRGYVVEDEQLVFDPGGAGAALDDLREGFDAAFPCYDHREGEEARRMGLNVVLVRPEDAALPNFAGLELFAADSIGAETLDAVRQGLDRAIERLSEDFAWAQRAWYAYGNTEPSALTDALVVAACSRFVAPVRARPDRWRPLFDAMFPLGLSALSPAEFERLYAAAEARAA